jgi:hypothetical protein
MAAFAVDEAGKITADYFCAKDSEKLNKKLSTIDKDISKKIGKDSPIHNYIDMYKRNNTDVIVNYMPHTMNRQEARAILLQFFALMEIRKVELNPENFRKYAHSSRVLWNSDVKEEIMDALDTLNLSNQTESDVSACMKALKAIEKNMEPQLVSIVRGLSIGVMYFKLSIPETKITNAAEEVKFEVEEVKNEGGFDVMDAAGQVASVVAIGLSIFDVVCAVWQIKDAIVQSKKMVHTLEHEIKPKYTKFFQGIKDSSAAYNAATNTKKQESMLYNKQESILERFSCCVPCV